MKFPKTPYFFDLKKFSEIEIFKNIIFPWQALAKLDKYVSQKLKSSKKKILVGAQSIIDKTVQIEGQVIIGSNCQIGPFTYLRGPVIIGDNCKLGRSEIKNSIIMSRSSAKHFNYISDSLIGNKVNFGGGSKIANFRFDKKEIKIKDKEKLISTGFRKFGAIIGDNSQLGINCCLNPGTVLGKSCLVYPLYNPKPGFYSSNSILKPNL